MQLQKETHPLSDSAFLSLLQARKTSFYRVAYGYVKNEEDAKDIVQEAVCKAYMAKDKLKETAKFYPWFYRILTNTAIAFLRQSSRTIAWDEELLQLPSNEDTDCQDDKLWIHDSLKRLDAKSRTVIILKVYEGMKFFEIAQILNKPESTVKSMYYRGLQFLKERMQCNGT